MTNLEMEAFFEIVKTGSISAAAESLYITQPALSRRLKTLEEELGYCLFDRRKGQRSTSLTIQGEAFIPIAKKWLSVWQEAQEVSLLQIHSTRRIAAVGSVATYILPNVLKQFSFQNEQSRICFHNYHSLEAYTFVDDGVIDLAFISDDMYHKRIETIPAFQEEMVFVSKSEQKAPAMLHPSMLDPQKEIRLPWNPEYESWHDFWFPQASYALSLDHMSLLEDFLTLEGLWAIVPASVANALKKRLSISIHPIEKGPSPRIIYYLKNQRNHPIWIQEFLALLHEEIKEIPYMISYVKQEDTHA